jgi:peptide deformylase
MGKFYVNEEELLVMEDTWGDAPTLPVLIWPNEKLHAPNTDVTVFDDELERLGRSLLRTMKGNNGVGLAAPQVGINKNIIAVWVDLNAPFVMVNPKIVSSNENLMEFEEGCLSVPGYFEKRKRPVEIIVEYQNVQGEQQIVQFIQLHAFCVQHEIDHLNGKVFVDDLSSLKKAIVKAKIAKTQKQKARAK